MKTDVGRRPWGGMREEGAAYSWAVFLAGAGGLLAILPAAGWPPTSMVVALSMTAVAATAPMVPMPAGGYQTLGSAVAAIGLVLLGAPATALAMGVGFILGNGMLHRRPLVVTLSNAGQAMLATLAARALAHAVTPIQAHWAQPILRSGLDAPFALAMVSAAFGYVFVSSTLVSWSIALRRRTSFVDVLGGNIAVGMINTFVLFSLGTIVALVISGGLPPSALLITIPVAMVSVTLLVYASRRQEAQELEVLYASAGEIGRNLSVDDVVQTVAAGAERLVAPDISLIYLRPPGDAAPRVVHYRGPGGMELARQFEPDGICGYVMRTGRAVRVGDYERDERRSPRAEALFGRGAVRSALVVPIATGGAVWGAIVLAKGTRAYFTARHERFIVTLAGQAALAVRNAHLFEETRRQVERAAALQHLGVQVRTTLDPDEACRLLTVQAAETLGTRYAFLVLFDERTREFYGQAAVGVDESEFTRFRRRLDGEGGELDEAVRAFRERRPVICNDLQGAPSPWSSLHALPDAHCALTVPLIRQGRPIGALTIVRTEMRPFAEVEIGALEAIAAGGAAAIENARLHASTQAQLRQMEAVVDISRHLRETLELQAVFTLLAESARGLLGVGRCALLAWDGRSLVGETLASGLSDEFTHALTQHVRASFGRAVLQAAGPLVITDLVGDSRMGSVRDAARTEGLRSGAFLPLRSQGESVGMLVFLDDRPRAYSAEELRLAEAFADQAAVAVKSTAVSAQGDPRYDEMGLLNRIVGSVSATLDLTEVLRTAVIELARATGAPRVSVHRLEGAVLRLAAQVGSPALLSELPVTSGIRGRVARTGRPEFVANVDDDPDYLGRSYAITGIAAVPILQDGVVAGVLAVDGTAGHPVTRQMYELLTALGPQVSVAVRNASLYQELRKAHDELQVLYEAAKSVSGTLDLRTVLDSLVSVTCRAFGYENGALLMVDPETGDLVVDAAYGHRESVIGKRLAPGVGITGAVARTGTPIAVDDVRQDSRYHRVDDRTRSELAVPLIAEGKVLGVFNVESARPAAFGARDLNMLTTLASYAVIAIQNARLYEQAQRLAITDGLTELHNHRYLYDALDRLLERAGHDGQPLALIMLEIDNFKRFNDTYGHQSGDEVLRTIAMLLRRGSRPLDIVARHGGDEFMVVLPGASKAAAQETGERLRRAVEAYPLVLAGDVVAAVTLSVGVAVFPDDGHTVGTLVEAVDRAQYTAKRSGGNKVHVAHGS